MAKMFVPETQAPETLADVPPEDPTLRSSNLMATIIAGATDGLKLAAGSPRYSSPCWGWWR